MSEVYSNKKRDKFRRSLCEICNVVILFCNVMTWSKVKTSIGSVPFHGFRNVYFCVMAAFKEEFSWTKKVSAVNSGFSNQCLLFYKICLHCCSKENILLVFFIMLLLFSHSSYLKRKLQFTTVLFHCAKIFFLKQNKLIYIIDSPSQHELVHSQQWKHQNNVWVLLKVNNKDIRSISLTSLKSHVILVAPFLIWTNKFPLG